MITELEQDLFERASLLFDGEWVELELDILEMNLLSVSDPEDLGKFVRGKSDGFWKDYFDSVPLGQA